MTCFFVLVSIPLAPKNIKEIGKNLHFFLHSTTNALLHAGARIDGPGMLRENESQSVRK